MYEKHLVRIGNSLGVVLDKPVLRAMGLGRKTKVRVRTDGYLIVVERAARLGFEPGRAARDAHELRRAAALDTARALDDSISPDQMAELGAGRMLLSSYTAHLARKTSFDARWLMVIDRLDHVRAGYDANQSSEQAVESAIAAVPSVPGLEVAHN